MSIFEDRNYVIIWAFETPITSGAGVRAEDLRNDFAAAVAMARQLFPREFEKSTITEYLDHSEYGIRFRFKIADVDNTTMHTSVWDVMDNQMVKITGHNWKLKYSYKTRSCAWGE